MPAISRLLIVCSSAVVAAIVLAFAQRADPHAAAAPLLPFPGHTFVVNSTVDAPDADQADNICASAGYGCTLRAAIDQANYQPDLDTIIVPVGTFALTRVGDEDDNLLGDLDIKYAVTIQGAGPGSTIVQWDPNITPTLRDRVFQIFPSATTTTLSGMTIRNGRYFSATSTSYGGGIYWTGGGGSLNLSNLRLENNQAGIGGGIYLNYPSQDSGVSLDQVTLRANQAALAGGAIAVILHGGTANFNLRSSALISNSALSGGGILLTGAGIYQTDLFALIANTEFYSNTAHSGGGITNEASNALHAVQLVDSHLHDNAADDEGGAIDNYGSLSLLRTVVDFNRAAIYGGGVATLELLRLSQSTVSHNAAQYGGGIYAQAIINTATQTYLLNSTISANTASRQGGGLYAKGGNIWSNNNTIAANQIVIPLGQTDPAMGAGILLTASYGSPYNYRALFTTTNTIIADNTTHNPRGVTTPDDCYGEINSQGYNLIESLSGCASTNFFVGDITGQDPHLGPLQLNGGTSATQALLPGSPAIDAGRPTGCTDAADAPITIDQRGVPRPYGPACDIGAYEVATNVAQEINFGPIPDRPLTASPFAITATASSGLTVTFSANTPSICTVSASSLNLLGVSVATVTLLKRGACTLVAQQPGDATFSAAAPVTRTFNVSAKLFLPLVVR